MMLGLAAKARASADALALAAGQRGRQAVAIGAGRQADQGQQFVHPRSDLRLRPAQQLGRDADILGHGQMREEADRLEMKPMPRRSWAGSTVAHRRRRPGRARAQVRSAG